MRPGLMGPQQQQQGGVMMGQQGAASSAGPGFPEVDMSHLSEEERMLIESVMAKAQMEEMELAASASAPAPKPPMNPR